MSTSNKRKSEFLGLSYSTASNRLKKQIMLMLLQRLNADVCFKCGEVIETPKELSVEHMEPWLERENGVEKFWDLDNIAFSHLSCNVPHDRNKESLRRIGPAGTAWCTFCKEFRPSEEFRRHAGRWNGLQNMCKPHQDAELKKRYA